jgi:hypothetical protein
MQEGLGSISGPPIGLRPLGWFAIPRSSGFCDRTPLCLSIQVFGFHNDKPCLPIGQFWHADLKLVSWHRLVLAALVSLPLLSLQANLGKFVQLECPESMI